MQFVVDRALPYKKYTIDFDELPAKSCIDINQQFYDDLIEKVNRDVDRSSSNNDFI